MSAAKELLAIVVALFSLLGTVGSGFFLVGRYVALQKSTGDSIAKIEGRLDTVEEIDRRLSVLETLERRVTAIEEARNVAITRHELDALLRIVHHDISSMSQTIANLFALVKEALNGRVDARRD